MQTDPQWQALAEQIAAHVARRIAEAPLPPPSPWLTPAQAACYLGLSIPGLEQMRRAGEGPAFSKVGARLVRYHLRDLDAWLARARTDTGA
ncbi:helix-turn-helix transcriptional regulator [Falsiroseomonas sp.]|uniref:helix-turn-helix transcriptional regulator n=1 Tax=Falsiroseomonas sp. TaxID=2870721 RepID=UPI003569B86A